MTRKEWAQELVKLADTLDSKGLTKEANELDSIVKEAWQGMEPKSLKDTMWYQRREDRKNELEDEDKGEEKGPEAPKSNV